MSEKKTKNTNKINKNNNKKRVEIKREYSSNEKVKPKNKRVYEIKEKFITKGRRYGDIIIRVPVEFNVFGKLKSHSKKLIFSLLHANEGLFCYNFKSQYKFDKCIKKKDLEKYINQLSKFKDYYEYDDQKTYKLDYFFYQDKDTNVYFYALNFNQLAKRYSEWKMDQEYLVTAFIPLKHNIYGPLNTDNKNEFNLVGTASIVNRSTGMIKSFTHITTGNYRIYAYGKMYENRNLNNNKPFVEYIDKPSKYKGDFNSLMVTLVIKNKKRS